MAAPGSLFWAPVTIALALLIASVCVDAALVQNFYSKSCPKAETTVASVVRSRVDADRTEAPSLLRLHFHDCFVHGCDGSVLLDSTPGNQAEKDSPPNANSLRGFDVIDQAKAAVDSICPGVVSCADIVALAARDAIGFIGGPSWAVPTGRRDGLVSLAGQAIASLPGNSFSFSQLKKNFAAVGLNEKDLTVLSAAHTIGQTHCATIIPRLYNFPGSANGIDPSLNKAYAKQLKKNCPQNSPTKLIPMDPSGGGEKFDTGYYSNIINNKGLFKSDEALLSNANARSQVTAELNSPSTFFSDFGQSMEKMGRIKVLTGNSEGQIRHNCHLINPSAHKVAAGHAAKKESSSHSHTKKSSH